MPTEESRKGYSGSTWIWIIDYPLAAQALQNAIYGMTNIELHEGRTTIIDLILGRTGTGGSSAQAQPRTTDENGLMETETPVTGVTYPEDTAASEAPSTEPEVSETGGQDTTEATAPDTSGQSSTEPPVTEPQSEEPSVSETQPEQTAQEPAAA